MTPRKAFNIASQWGSYVRAGDRGACLYAFHFEDGRPVNEDHRRECLHYIDWWCMPAIINLYATAREQSKRLYRMRAQRDWRDMVLLRRYLAKCELRPT